MKFWEAMKALEEGKKIKSPLNIDNKWLKVNNWLKLNNLNFDEFPLIDSEGNKWSLKLLNFMDEYELYEEKDEKKDELGELIKAISYQEKEIKDIYNRIRDLEFRLR